MWHFGFFLTIEFLTAPVLLSVIHFFHIPKSFSLGAGLTILWNILFTLFVYWGFRLKGHHLTIFNTFREPENKDDLNVEAEDLHKRTIQEAFFGFLLGVALIIVNFILAMFIHSDHWSWLFGAKTEEEIIMLFFVVIAASICEEIRYRAYFFRQVLGVTNSLGMAIVIQAAFFMLIHGLDQGPLGFLYRFIIGIVFGLVAYKKNSLVPSMAAHLTINFFIFLLVLYVALHS
jgi:membrane protease YdiL (CAAX protease family)